MTEYIVRARSDGRGGIRPFNTFSSEEAGQRVTIGGQSVKVSSDGRINISKSIMDKFGATGSDGRKRISIQFASEKETKKTSARIYKPAAGDEHLSTGKETKKTNKWEEVLEPYDDEEYNWNT